ncbi:phosphonate metabolism protein/1,5-bisphosphokinase (PRPP-forming) PhnN [Rhizobacter sp. LjRoot28]|uniref:phosphonate metabolism protein/1,5-bisphosphokinase (PRPP-forming) PhnN n=1 Tax=Rhizobacter sp. LjRoot28 TaxID=3342309 RepID=UPI003ED1101A
MTARHAVYWVPAEGHPLWRAGCNWLGRDPAAGTPPGRAPSHREEPWRYGFHATVKAPMAWRDGADETAWMDALAALAARHGDATMPTLSVTWLRDFMALCPAPPLPAPLMAMAADAVTRLDVFRAPVSPEERSRRIRGLDAEGIRLFDEWGYAHVLSRWQPHLTLSDSMPYADAALKASLQAEAQQHFASALAVPLGLGELAWFREPAPGRPFELVRRFPLGGPAPSIQGSERLIVVVGPSGAGKDSLLKAWRAGLPPGTAPLQVRRVITRPADPGGEDHEAVDVAAFERLRRAGQLAFWWSAHGLHYGVRHTDLAPLAQGRWVVMNGSRAHLTELKDSAPGAHVVQVTAPADVLAARLAARQRESAEAVAGRLGREVQTVPASLVVPNHGDLAEAVACLHRWWEGLVRRAA